MTLKDYTARRGTVKQDVVRRYPTAPPLPGEEVLFDQGDDDTVVMEEEEETPHDDEKKKKKKEVTEPPIQIPRPRGKSNDNNNRTTSRTATRNIRGPGRSRSRTTSRSRSPTGTSTSTRSPNRSTPKRNRSFELDVLTRPAEMAVQPRRRLPPKSKSADDSEWVLRLQQQDGKDFLRPSRNRKNNNNRDNNNPRVPRAIPALRRQSSVPDVRQIEVSLENIPVEDLDATQHRPRRRSSFSGFELPSRVVARIAASAEPPVPRGRRPRRNHNQTDPLSKSDTDALLPATSLERHETDFAVIVGHAYGNGQSKPRRCSLSPNSGRRRRPIHDNEQSTLDAFLNSSLSSFTCSDRLPSIHSASTNSPGTPLVRRTDLEYSSRLLGTSRIRRYESA